MKHSPGPWFIGSFLEDELTQILTGDASEGTLKVVALTKPEHARLISASPDMIEALEYILVYANKNISEEGESATMHVIKRAAENVLAKARGEL